MSRNEAENKVWEVDSDIIARESARDRRGTAAETVRRRKKKSFKNLVQKKAEQQKRLTTNFTSLKN